MTDYGFFGDDRFVTESFEGSVTFELTEGEYLRFENATIESITLRS